MSLDDEPRFQRLSAGDADGDDLIYKVIDPPSFGIVNIRDPESGYFTYIPNIGYGTDTFTFRVSDGKDSTDAIATIEILAGNYSENETNNDESVANGIYVSSVVLGNTANKTDEDWFSLSSVPGYFRLGIQLAKSESYNVMTVQLFDQSMSLLSSIDVDPYTDRSVAQYMYFGVSTDKSSLS